MRYQCAGFSLMIVSVNVVLERTVGYNDVSTTCVEVIITFIIFEISIASRFFQHNFLYVTHSGLNTRMPPLGHIQLAISVRTANKL